MVVLRGITRTPVLYILWSKGCKVIYIIDLTMFT